MMLIFALGASISFSSCGSDDEDIPGGNGTTTSGGGASATSMPGSYIGITADDSRTLTAIFVEDGTGIINENGEQYPLTYSMGGDTGLVKVEKSHGTYTYTIKFIDGFMLLESSGGDIYYYFYKSGRNLGSPNAKKIIGSWERKAVHDNLTTDYNRTFNSDGTSTLVCIKTYADDQSQKSYKRTLTYKMENAYVAKCTECNDEHYTAYAAILLNNKLYIYGDITEPNDIYSKKE